jgi:hypothetical protein
LVLDLLGGHLFPHLAMKQQQWAQQVSIETMSEEPKKTRQANWRIYD